MEYYVLRLTFVLLACAVGCSTTHLWTNPCDGESPIQREFASSLIIHRESAVRDILSSVPTSIDVLNSNVEILQNLYEETGRDDAITETGDVILEQLNVNHIQYCRQIRNPHRGLSKVHELLVRSVVYLSLSLEGERQETEERHTNPAIEVEMSTVKNGLLDLLCVMDKIHAVKRFRKTTEADMDLSRFSMGSTRRQRHGRDVTLFNNVRRVLSCARTLFNRM